MKNRILFVSTLVLALTTVAWSALHAASSDRPAASLASERAVHTTGTAVIRVQPDRATVRLGVQTFERTPRASQAENDAIVKRVLKALEAQGIPSQDIGTDSFTLRPEYEYPQRGQQSLVGYWTDNGVRVTLRQVDKLSDVLVAALEAGATSVDDLTFSTSRLRALRDEARANAVRAALEKAGALADAAGATAGEVRELRENSWSYYYGAWNSRGQMSNGVQNVMQEVPAASGAPALEEEAFSLGQIVVQAQVEVTVELR